MSLIEFYTAEALAAHAAMDKTSVPRTLDGEKLSLSQRVEILADAMRDVTSDLLECVDRRIE